MMKNITNISYKVLLFLVILIPFNLNSKTVVDLIKTNPDLSLFYSHLKETGLEEVLEKNYPGNGQFLLLLIRHLNLFHRQQKIKFYQINLLVKV